MILVILFLCPLFALTLIVAGIISAKEKKMTSFYAGVVACIAIVTILVVLELLWFLESPETKFKRVVADPIPNEIENIEGKWDLFVMDQTYYFSFDLSDKGFMALKSLKSYSLYNPNSIPMIPAVEYFPIEWRDEIRKHSIEAFTHTTDMEDYHLMLYSNENDRCYYVVITI